MRTVFVYSEINKKRRKLYLWEKKDVNFVWVQFCTTAQLSVKATQCRIAKNGYRHSGLANASLFNPPGSLAPAIKTFKEVVLKDLERIRVSKSKMRGNLEVGLESLCNNKSLVIRPADKGGGIVILDRSDYLEEMHRIVDDLDTYTPLIRDPVVKYKKELEVIVDRGYRQGILDKREKLFLVPSAPRTPVIYYLPKVHKSLTCPPGRPIVSGIDSVMSRVGKYIDHFLQPFSQKRVLR